MEQWRESIQQRRFPSHPNNEMAIVRWLDRTTRTSAANPLRACTCIEEAPTPAATTIRLRDERTMRRPARAGGSDTAGDTTPRWGSAVSVWQRCDT